MTTDVDICNRALQMTGNRNKLSSLSGSSEEAENCNLLYTQVRDQVLGMSFWNFARKIAPLNLIKAAPGTPEAWIKSENIGNVNLTGWYNWMPAVPWAYEYQYPTDCIQFRYLTGQQTIGQSGVPIFSTPQYTYMASVLSWPQKFAIATDLINTVINIQGMTQANPAVVSATAHGLITSNFVWFSGVLGMVEINTVGLAPQATVINANSFSVPIDTTSFSRYGPTNYPGNNGIVVNLSSNQVNGNVILANTPQALGVYTMQVTDLNLWSAQAIQALVTAMAGFLAIPLSGDKSLADRLLNQANTHIIQARASDGNEGYTVQETIPDWLRIRDGYTCGNIDYGSNITPYPPLFAVA